jgi:formylglycine-generating enzyme required for sulfatase activity
MEKDPPSLSFNPDGDVAYVGRRTKSSTPSHAAILKNSIGMEFVLIPAGSFTMGSTIGRESEKPPHEVNISQSLYLQTTEVSQGQWKRVMGDSPSSFKECGDDCPVENVSWDDVKDFIKKLNVMERTDKYRLPTEAEWEYACRAEKTTEFSFGDDGGNLDEYAWYEGNSKEATHKVAAKKPNPWGLYDMHGNIWEWVEDDWHYGYDGAPGGGQAWIDKPRDSLRVIRGGSWESNEFDCRSAPRFGEKPGNRSFSLGFRLAKSVAPGP